MLSTLKPKLSEDNIAPLLSFTLYLLENSLPRLFLTFICTSKLEMSSQQHIKCVFDSTWQFYNFFKSDIFGLISFFLWLCLFLYFFDFWIFIIFVTVVLAAVVLMDYTFICSNGQESRHLGTYFTHFPKYSTSISLNIKVKK